MYGEPVWEKCFVFLLLLLSWQSQPNFTFQSKLSFLIRLKDSQRKARLEVEFQIFVLYFYIWFRHMKIGKVILSSRFVNDKGYVKMSTLGLRL